MASEQLLQGGMQGGDADAVDDHQGYWNNRPEYEHGSVEPPQALRSIGSGAVQRTHRLQDAGHVLQNLIWSPVGEGHTNIRQGCLRAHSQSMVSTSASGQEPYDAKSGARDTTSNSRGQACATLHRDALTRVN